MRKVGVAFLGTIVFMLSITGISEAVEVQVETGSFRGLERVETALKRGVSNKEDVKRLFGEPNGVGGAFFPTGKESSEIWYYEDIELEGAGTTSGGIFRMKMRAQVLIVFFDGNQFDGFMWFTAAEEGKGESNK